ncbi:MAG: hypothetical protein HY753_07725 [Nitrospirae bacterium]|nr:hypothetical protein [Nitrospirota bacterium]
MTSKTDAYGAKNYTYDSINRLKTISEGITFGYDNADNRTSMSSPSASMSYSYDNANRLTQKSETIAGKTYKTQYGYNGNDFISDIYYPKGHHVIYGYNMGRHGVIWKAWGQACLLLFDGENIKMTNGEETEDRIRGGVLPRNNAR